MSRQNVWILSRVKTVQLDGRQYCHTKSQREALLLLSPLVVTHLQCCIAIREQHKNKIRLNAHDRRQTLQLESTVWQACVIYCDCMIYLASQRRAGSFLIPFTIISTAISQRCRAGTVYERSINGLLMLPSYICSLCYFNSCLWVMFWTSGFFFIILITLSALLSPAFLIFFPPTLCYTWRIMIVSVQQSSMWWELVGFMEMRTTTVHPCQFLCSICWVGCTWKVYFLNGWQTAVKAHFDTRGNLDSSINQLCFLENILI